jgi:hypothetical protein
MRNASLPYHLYVNVCNLFLGPDMPAGSTPGIWHAASCRPGQTLLCHVLLDTGAHWSGLPIHALSVSDKFDRHHADLMPWSAMGEHLEITAMPYLEGLDATIHKPFDSRGRHTGMIFDWADGFSRYPQEHKPLSLIQTIAGQLALLPNNFFTLSDKHFTRSDNRQQLALYRRGETVYWGH